jgi:hypothetical protein
MTQWLGVLVTNAHLACRVSSRCGQIEPGLHEDEELIFCGKILFLATMLYEGAPTTAVEEMAQHYEQRPSRSKDVGSKGSISSLNARDIDFMERLAEQTGIAAADYR